MVFVALAPWRQNVSGQGQVLAYLPQDRPQSIDAPISGVVARWHVREGQRVAPGDLLVELRDNDPNRFERLTLERDMQVERLRAYEAQVAAYRERVDALIEAREAQLAAARAEIRVASASLNARREALAAAETGAVVAGTQARRISELAEEGLASTRENELASLSQTRGDTGLRAARAAVDGARSSLAAKRAALDRVDASTAASLRSAEAALSSSETQVASARASLARAESSLARQGAQQIQATAPGIVRRIFLQEGPRQVSSGELLAEIVPDASTPAVHLSIDGNDAALIAPGRRVRLQFEGWPAAQFAGWPSVAVGTFGGTVAFVDPSDQGDGDFRVVVVPDPEDEAWPEARFLRQGTRAKGWVLLEEVRVGFEIWRQINGFPPRYQNAPGASS